MVFVMVQVWMTSMWALTCQALVINAVSCLEPLVQSSGYYDAYYKKLVKSAVLLSKILKRSLRIDLVLVQQLQAYCDFSS